MNDILVQKTAEDLASKSLQVTVPVDRVAAATERAVKQYARRARLPGFRPGHAPDAVVRKRFAPEIRQHVLEEVIREGWEEAKTAEGLEPVTDPSVRNVKYEEGQPVEFELLVEVRPKVTLERIGGFTVARREEPVTDEVVGEQIDRIRDQRATWLPVEEGATPAPGHLVRVEVAPVEDGVVHEAKAYDMVLGEGHAIPDLEDRIMSLTAGTTAEADVRFPDDYADPARRGQTRRVRITLHEIKKKELPPLDDAFAKEAGDFDSLAALRAGVRADLEAEARRQADEGVRSAIVAQIVEANNLVAPPTMVGRVLRALAKSYEVPEDRLEPFAQQFQAAAATRVLRDLVVDAVAEGEKLKATEADVDARVQALAESRGVPAGKLYSSLQQANRLPELEHGLTEEKVFAFLLSQSTIT